MNYYEVWVADGRYHSDKPLTYSFDGELAPGNVVTVPLRNRMISAFIAGKVNEPAFATKPIKNVLSATPLPPHCLELARWLSDYYVCNFGDALRQFAPAKPTLRASKTLAGLPAADSRELKLVLDSKLTVEQSKAISAINKARSTVLLHGDTGTGKTRVYLELAKQTIASGKSAMILTPEISLVGQLAKAAADFLHAPTHILHSGLTASQRKKTWLKILESDEPVIIIGPRSALFAPIKKIGLIVIDEAHEPAYKQEQTPRYQTTRTASQLGILSGSKVVLGTATPSLDDYYLASQKKAIVRMSKPAIKSTHAEVVTMVVDIKDRQNFSRDPHLSNQLIDAVTATLADGKQVMIYLNRRGSARVILCSSCGWQLLCPNCDIPLVYHGDAHQARCHSCGYNQSPPSACPICKSHDILYKSIGTKALAESVQRLFPNHALKRFDSDNTKGETVNDSYADILSGKVDILVGTQLLAKGLDLPKLGLVGIVAAETSLSLPDFTSEERTFQLLYQVAGRVGRGHTSGQVIVQAHHPKSPIIRSAVARDYQKFYKKAITERQAFRFPPYAYLLKLVCRKTSAERANQAAEKLKQLLLEQALPVEIIGPMPSFYGRRGPLFYYQLVVKSKDRKHLVELAKLAPADWSVDLDPSDLL